MQQSLVGLLLRCRHAGVRAARRHLEQGAREGAGGQEEARRPQRSPTRKSGRSATTSARRSATRFGVVQDAAVHKYVTLVGTVARAGSPSGPNLPWTFIVLDTDGVNAFASPGGFVHITRGALGLIKNEAELAGVLGHEIGHVAHKHTVNAIRKSNAVKLGTSEALADRGPFLDKLANMAYDMVLENKFDRGDELDADKVSVALAQKVGYAPAALADFLDAPRRAQQGPAGAERPVRVASRDARSASTRSGSWPASKTGAVVRRALHVEHQVPADRRSRRSRSSSKARRAWPGRPSRQGRRTKPKKEEEPKKKGFGLGALKKAVGAGEADRAGVGLGRRSRSRSGSARQGWRQPATR